MADTTNTRLTGTTATRRNIIAALLASPFVACATLAIAADDKDARLIAAWNTRQSALATIEARGNFFHAETHSPEAAQAFDLAEMDVHTIPAATTRGAICKLWIALSHIGIVHNEDDRREHDAIRRADLPEVASFADQMGFAEAGIFAAIRNLTFIVEG